MRREIVDELIYQLTAYPQYHEIVRCLKYVSDHWLEHTEIEKQFAISCGQIVLSIMS